MKMILGTLFVFVIGFGTGSSIHAQVADEFDKLPSTKTDAKLVFEWEARNDEVEAFLREGFPKDLPLAYQRYNHAVALGQKALEKDSLESQRYDLAVSLGRKALEFAEQAFGRDHLAVSTSLNNLALIEVAKGEWTAADGNYYRALEIREKALGPDHSDVATILNNWAMYYYLRGQDVQEGVKLCERSLSIRERALGPDHPDVAASLNTLGMLYSSDWIRKYAQALTLYKRALAIREKALGPNHLAVAESLENLATLYRETGYGLQGYRPDQMYNPINWRAKRPEVKEVMALEKRAATIRAKKR